MADNKASALKDAKNKYQLKIYYSGDTPADSGSFVIDADALDSEHTPWLIKIDAGNNMVHQYADTTGIYHKISQDLATILDAVIVNAKQRTALDKVVDNMLSGYLCEDLAHEKDFICDYFEK